MLKAPQWPAAVVAGNVETSARQVTNCLFGALERAGGRRRAP
jgi:N-methylhydantoinase B/oxoprolinase/acetone carboxylase alpha subunit